MICGKKYLTENGEVLCSKPAMWELVHPHYIVSLCDQHLIETRQPGDKCTPFLEELLPPSRFPQHSTEMCEECVGVGALLSYGTTIEESEWYPCSICKGYGKVELPPGECGRCGGPLAEVCMSDYCKAWRDGYESCRSDIRQFPLSYAWRKSLAEKWSKE
jgi:hypothetical protein